MSNDEKYAKLMKQLIRDDSEMEALRSIRHTLDNKTDIHMIDKRLTKRANKLRQLAQHHVNTFS